MKAICIDNIGLRDSLTIGKWYDIDGFNEFDEVFDIINDKGVYGAYFTKRFRLLNDIREEKLIQLGI